MKKEERIARYGEEAYEKHLAQSRAWAKEHPEEVTITHQEANRKGGKHYNRKLRYNQMGIQGAKKRIRGKHGNQYRPYKNIIAPESQLHHEWIPETAEYRGIALVETDAHMHGFVDVIAILAGKITLLREDKIKKKVKEK